ncbi:hypothetical protein [Azohydromonas lata]|uniref:hypothetical protein n=1 Tax=Azohydromonas lata TaxID=45677 RepID=UPI0012F48CA9|nr:hypothetical protein [Azohydromonas lata]
MPLLARPIAQRVMHFTLHRRVACQVGKFQIFANRLSSEISHESKLVSVYRKLTVFFITPEGETHSARIELSSTCHALVANEKLDAVLAEALERWEQVAGVQVIDLSRQESETPARETEAVGVLFH